MAILLPRGGSAAAAVLQDCEGPWLGLILELPTHCAGRELLISGRIISGRLTAGQLILSSSAGVARLLPEV